MQLHEFMCREVVAQGQLLRDNPACLAQYPSHLGMVCDFERARVHHQVYRRGDENRPEVISFALDGDLRDRLVQAAGRKARRSAELVDHLRGLNARWFAGNMGDAAPFSPELYFHHPVNILQYNRRIGDPFGVLWRLPDYYEPSSRLGFRFEPGDVRDTVPFAEKKPLAVWRGSTTSEEWVSPHETRKLRGVWPGGDARDDTADWSPRLKAVRYSIGAPHIANCRFAYKKKALDAMGVSVEESLRSPYATRQKSKDWLLEHKYQLCLPGSDVATQLYWVIGTNALALKVQTEYEVIPDFHLRPWVHYVPIARDLHDLADKIAYLEANPDLCQAIIDRANEAHARIIDPAPWEEAERTVLDRLGLLAP